MTERQRCGERRNLCAPRDAPCAARPAAHPPRISRGPSGSGRANAGLRGRLCRVAGQAMPSCRPAAPLAPSPASPSRLCCPAQRGQAGSCARRRASGTGALSNISHPLGWVRKYFHTGPQGPRKHSDAYSVKHGFYSIFFFSLVGRF